MIEEKDLTPDTLISKIEEIIDDSVKLKVMKNNLKKLKVEDSSLLIYKELRDLIK